MLGQEEFKLVQYADDLTLFVKLILQLFDRFTIYLDLKVNHSAEGARAEHHC